MQQSRKRSRSPGLVPNPLIKKRNLAWSLDSPASHPQSSTSISGSPRPTAGTTAGIESGSVTISDHLSRFSSSLSSHLRPTSAGVPRLSVAGYSHLFQRCSGSPQGAHFVVHQHDHPVAGTHYDLRLQINESSSASWAVMYGLPGDANSSRPSRNATETRVHCLWNHLVETASPETGSLLIWDTGTYSILPRTSKHAPPQDPSSPPASRHSQSPSQPPSPSPASSPQSLLHAAFQDRKIRLRLHGAKLPDPYVINLRLTKSEDAAGRSRGLQGRRNRRRGRTTARVGPEERETSPSSASSSSPADEADVDGRDLDTAEKPVDRSTTDGPSPSEQQDAQTRLTNAYPGASNTIGSVHQRRWYLSLDRRACGFTEKRRRGRSSLWEPPPAEPPPIADDPSGSEPGSSRLSFPFYVRGPQFEQSVVTGRRGEDVLRDEGVTTFVPRKGWKPVMK